MRTDAVVHRAVESGPSPIWARPRFVAAAIVAYLVVHFATRMAMWPTLGIDDSEQALFAQGYAWSYRVVAPPLFTWILVTLGKAIGINIVSISIIRYALLGVIFGFAYASARRLILDLRLSALAVYGFAAIYMFAFYSHHDLTHTTMLSAALSVAWYAFLRLAASPRPGWYLTLGAVFGLGLLGKWNFAMFAAALPLACLVLPLYRRLVLTWKIVPAILLSALIVLPTVATNLAADPAGGDDITMAVTGEPGSGLAKMANAVGRLAASAIVYPQPLLVMVVLFLGLPLWRGVRHPAPRAAPAAPLTPDVAFIAWTIGIALALHLALIPFGARQFYERLMQPPLFILPILLFMLIERGRPSRRAVNLFAAVLALLVAGTLAARIVDYLRGADHCSSCRNMAPFAALGEQLRAAGFTGSGTILTEGFHVGGNMRVVFPQARVIDVAYPPSRWPTPASHASCLMVWQVRDDRPMSDTARYLEAYLPVLGGELSAPHREGEVSALMFSSATRQYRLGYRLYDGPTGDCR